MTAGVTYTEVLQVIKGDGIAKKMDQSILKHASVTVTASLALADVFRSPNSGSRVTTRQRSSAEKSLRGRRSHGDNN